jgi:hypothetical protein
MLRSYLHVYMHIFGTFSSFLFLRSFWRPKLLAWENFWFSLLLLVGRERPRKLTAQMQKAHGSLTWRAESKRQKGWTPHVWPALGFYPSLLLFLITACSRFLGVPISLPHNCFQESVRISRKVLLQQSDPILPPHNFFQEIHQYF